VLVEDGPDIIQNWEEGLQRIPEENFTAGNHNYFKAVTILAPKHFPGAQYNQTIQLIRFHVLDLNSPVAQAQQANETKYDNPYLDLQKLEYPLMSRVFSV
jgi:hypothetical protein